MKLDLQMKPRDHHACCKLQGPTKKQPEARKHTGTHECLASPSHVLVRLIVHVVYTHMRAVCCVLHVL